MKKDQIAYLKDKLQSWPGEMALTSEDIADLLALLESHPPLPPRIRTEADSHREYMRYMSGKEKDDDD